jgi:hypothetical protein
MVKIDKNQFVTIKVNSTETEIKDLQYVGKARTGTYEEVKKQVASELVQTSYATKKILVYQLVKILTPEQIFAEQDVDIEDIKKVDLTDTKVPNLEI